MPMSVARWMRGIENKDTRHVFLGQNGHVLTFPVTGNSPLNVVASVTAASNYLFQMKSQLL